MSTTAHRPPVGGRRPDEFPRFELDYLFDDTVDPSEVTVYSPDADVTTCWLSVDVGTAVPLEDVP